jgi:hypothetical protein
MVEAQIITIRYVRIDQMPFLFKKPALTSRASAFAPLLSAFRHDEYGQTCRCKGGSPARPCEERSDAAIQHLYAPGLLPASYLAVCNDGYRQDDGYPARPCERPPRPCEPAGGSNDAPCMTLDCFVPRNGYGQSTCVD